MFSCINLLKFEPNASHVCILQRAAHKVSPALLSKIDYTKRNCGAQINISFFRDSAIEKSHFVLKSSLDAMSRPCCRRRKRRVVPLSCSMPRESLVVMHPRGPRMRGLFVRDAQLPSSAYAGAVDVARQELSL